MRDIIFAGRGQAADGDNAKQTLPICAFFHLRLKHQIAERWGRSYRTPRKRNIAVLKEASDGDGKLPQAWTTGGYHPSHPKGNPFLYQSRLLSQQFRKESWEGLWPQQRLIWYKWLIRSCRYVWADEKDDRNGCDGCWGMLWLGTRIHRPSMPGLQGEIGELRQMMVSRIHFNTFAYDYVELKSFMS